MDLKVIYQISWPFIVSMISDAKRWIRIVIPSIHDEWSILLCDARKRGINIKVCLNNSDKSIRDGFGDDKAVQKLLENGIIVNESKPNRISLISVDDSHFLYFPISRIFEDITDEGINNALALDPAIAITLLTSFFPEDLLELRKLFNNNIQVINNLTQERIENISEKLSFGKLDIQAKELDREKFNIIQQGLRKNPPVEPDLKRSIEVYNLKIQFVELKFENGKISGKRVRIPKNALPFESNELKKILDAGMRIFTDNKENQEKTLEEYASLQIEVKELRDKYLIPIKCRPEKSVLLKNKISEFQKGIDDINAKIQSKKQNLINDLDSEIVKAKDRLENELYNFYLKNDPEKLKEYYSKEKLPNKIKEYVVNIMTRIKFPKAHEMVEGMKLIRLYYDLTWNDFSDSALLKEFSEKGVLIDDLDSIRKLTKAIEIKK